MIGVSGGIVDNKFDFFVAKLMSGQTQFSAVTGQPEFKGLQLAELLQFAIHNRDSIQFSGDSKSILASDDRISSELMQKLVAAGFTVEPLKVAR
jgi:hypothetical protein